MSDIILTHEHVRKLTAAISKVDGRELKQHERIEMVASAFGWRADALMHHLKKSKSKENGSDYSVTDEAKWLRSHFEWPSQNLANQLSKGGITLIIGRTRTGKITATNHLCSYLYRIYGHPILLPKYQMTKDEELSDAFAMAEEDGYNVIAFELRNELEHWERACSLASKGARVIVRLLGFDLENTVTSMIERGVKKADLDLIRAALVLRIAEKGEPSGLAGHVYREFIFNKPGALADLVRRNS